MSTAEVQHAKSICYLCPVRLECLTYAIETDERWGVWGGLTAAERKRAHRAFPTTRALENAYDDGELFKTVRRR